MNVIAMMSFVGLALVAFFLAFFVHQTNSESGSEQDALMPLDEETARPATKHPSKAAKSITPGPSSRDNPAIPTPVPASETKAR